MKTRSLGYVAGVVVAALSFGCGYQEPAEGLEPILAVARAEGREPNGSVLNSSVPEFVSFSGAVQQNGTPFDMVYLNGSALEGLSGGALVTGTGFSQARFVGTLSNGAQVSLRVDSMTANTGSSGDIWLYRVSYYDVTYNQWSPICRDAQGAATDAIALNGRWNYGAGVVGGGSKIVDSGVFTLACQGEAMAKCVNFGYRPWAKSGSVSLADAHQACTRMLRADYCGDGMSHTTDGQWVNVFDNYNIEVDTETWAFEAEWDTEGARCITQTLRAHTPVTCPNERTVSACGDLGHFYSGALLMSETPF